VSEHIHKYRLQSFNNESGGVTIGVADCECGEVIGPSAIERRLNATERLSQLAKNLQSGKGWGPERDELVPEDQRGAIAQYNWYDSMFMYGMEYGVLAAAALEGEDDLSKLP